MGEFANSFQRQEKFVINSFDADGKTVPENFHDDHLSR
jgi:hypothetical protein